VSVSTQPAPETGGCDFEAQCEISGGALYVDRNFAGAVPCAGNLPPGGHYFSLSLPGYDDLGIWIILDAGKKYTIGFNPEGKMALFSPKEKVSVSSEPTLNEGRSDLLLYCSAGGATLLLDKGYIGVVPKAGVSSGGLPVSVAPGSHYLEVSSPGYHDLGVWLLFEEKTKYTIVFRPARITGFLRIDIEPADASLSLDGSSIERGLVEVPAGTHTLRAKSFGHVERSLDLTVAEGSTVPVSLSLEKAAFAIHGLGFSRAVFNPRNSGAPGRTSLDFRATSYGSATAEIRGPGGELAATLEFPDIATWNQSRTWDGRAADGSVLPDGVYSATLTARPAPGVPAPAKARPDGSLVRKAELRIDSSLVIRSFGTASAVPGLLLMPDPLAQSAGTVAAEASWFTPWGRPQASAFGLSAALSLGGAVTLALHAAAETGDAPATAADLSGSALATVFGDRAGPAVGALFLRGSYCSSSSPSLPGSRSAVEASFPLALRLGDLSFAVSPGALATFAQGNTTFLALARCGLWVEGSSFRLGLSCELPIGFAGAPPSPLPFPSPIWPARAALEGRLMLGSTPFVAAGFVTAELAPDAAPAFGVGIGLGLLF
jgi:hypothetical protein